MKSYKQKEIIMGRPKGIKNRTKDPSEPKKPRAKQKQASPGLKRVAPPASSPNPDANLEFKKPSSGQVETLAKRLDSIARESKELGETKKEIFDKAVETQHFNRTAISKALDWRKRAKRDPAKFSIEFAHFLSYVDDLKLGEIANDNRGLAINGEDDEVANAGIDDGQTNLVDAIAKAIEADTTGGDFYDSAARGTNEMPHRLSIVPGPNAPQAPDEDDEAAA